MGDASPGRTQLRLCLGNAISAARSDSVMDSEVESYSESASSAPHLSSASRFDLVTARGKEGAKAERTLALSLRGSRGGGSTDDDSEKLVSWLTPRFERLLRPVTEPLVDDPPFCR